MKAITFSLKTMQPMLATSFQGDPNSDVSYLYIPGSTIRGLLIGRYLKRNNFQDVDILADEMTRRLFFDGKTRYLNAYLSSQEGYRTLPRLLSWRKKKGAEFTDINEGIKVYDFSVDKPDEDELKSPKAIDEPFWIEEGGCVRLYTVDRRINIHNSRDRRQGRSTQTEGEIFCYNAIDAGQTFQGVILCQDDDKQAIEDLLQPPDAWLGGSRSAGYGHVKITDLNSSDSWSEVGSHSSAEDRTENKSIKITLLSDLIIRDEWGQYVAAPPTLVLAKFLGRELAEPETAYMDSVFIGGFNQKWGLPLPQVLAVKAGSVFVYQDVEITPEQIRQLEAEGIGERRVEGFGRIAVNWRLEESQFQAKTPEPPELPEPPQLQSPESQKLAGEMAERILRQKLEGLLLKRVESHKLEANQMTNSQLSRLMIVTRQALDENSRQPLDNLLKQLPSKAREQYERTKLKKKIENLLEGEWIEKRQQKIKTAIAGEAATLTPELKMEYTLRLILAIAKNAIKEKAKEENANEQ